MHISIKVGLVLLLFTMTINAHAHNWQTANTIDIPYSLNAVDMLEDGLTGWAVCNNAIILKTTDGWKTWEFQAYASDIDFNLYDVDFVDENIGWAVGGGRTLPSIVLFTNDGGKNWIMQSINLLYQINTISAVDSNHAWCAGNDGIIYKTVDHESWQSCSIENTKQINGIYMVNHLKGIAVCDDQTIFYTTDGHTWQKSEQVPNIEARNINNVWMVDSQIAWAVGDASCYKKVSTYLLKSKDGGVTWEREDIDVTLFENLKSIKFDSGKRGIAAGAKGVVFVTNDGDNWTRLQRQFANETQDVAISGRKFWSFGGMGIIQYSADFGNSWNLVPKTTAQPLYKIKAISDSLIIAIGYYSAIMRSNDGGLTWRSSCIIDDDDFCLRLEGLDFADDKIGWACGANGFLAKTTDAGETWKNQSNSDITQGNWLNNIEVIDQNTIWCCGRNSLLISSTKGGDQLITHEVPATSNLNDIAFFNSEKGLIVGDGTLLYTTDSGSSWHNAEYDSEAIPKLICCQIVDSDFSIAMSNDGSILKSFDLGQHWSFTGKIGREGVTSILFRDNLSGWATNSDGIILYSENSGQTWTEQYFHTQGLYSLTTTDSKIFACGLRGTVVKTDINISRCDVDEQNSNNPKDYVLYQNYPNPFNSSTNIVYQVKKPQHIFAAVYNTLGKEVKVLFNNFKATGTYIHHLHLDNLSSGVYYLKMRTNNSVSTKRLVHIK